MSRKADIIVSHSCAGECGRKLYLQGWNVLKKKDVPSDDGSIVQVDHIVPFRFSIDLVGHMEPDPDGCLMKLGDEWLAFWLSKPMEEKETKLTGSEIQLADRPQLSRMYALCKSCLHLGGKRLFPIFLKGFMGGTSIQISVRSVFGIMALVVDQAATHNRAMREKSNGKKS